MDFWIGDEAVSRAQEYTVNYPIRHGIVENWDNMERYWQHGQSGLLPGPYQTTTGS